PQAGSGGPAPRSRRPAAVALAGAAGGGRPPPPPPDSVPARARGEVPSAGDEGRLPPAPGAPRGPLTGLTCKLRHYDFRRPCRQPPRLSILELRVRARPMTDSDPVRHRGPQRGKPEREIVLGASSPARIS